MSKFIEGLLQVTSGLPIVGDALEYRDKLLSAGTPINLMRLRGGKVGGVKAKDLWEKVLRTNLSCTAKNHVRFCLQNGDDLLQMEEDLRTELMSLRVAQQVGGQPGKVNRIKMIRKAIARVLTVQTAKRRGEAFNEVSSAKSNRPRVRPFSSSIL
jgi:ribosomal protein L29